MMMMMICIKIDLALNNPQWLKHHKTKPNYPANQTLKQRTHEYFCYRGESNENKRKQKYKENAENFVGHKLGLLRIVFDALGTVAKYLEKDWKTEKAEEF